MSPELSLETIHNAQMACLYAGMGVGVFIGWVIGAFTAIVCLSRRRS